MKDIPHTIHDQRSYFNTSETRDVEFRIRALRRLRQSVIDNERVITDALYTDLGKSAYETYMTETGLFLQEIGLHIKKLAKWTKPVRVKTPLHTFPAKSFIYPEPYGVVLVIAPWNFPFLLSMVPLAGAIAAGNCVVLKPAHYSEYTSRVLEAIVRETFDEKHVSVFLGGREVNEALLGETFDYIFFTGSASLGRLVMERASRNLTPLTLELGGKSPAIVDRDAEIDMAARRIAWGKFLNAGQTCVCPDYVLVHEAIKSDFIDRLNSNIEALFTKDPSVSPDYGRIINRTHWRELHDLYSERLGKNGFIKGEGDEESLFIPPVVLVDVDEADPSMQEEIFGPVLPVMSFESIDNVIEKINLKPTPLSVYYFGNNKETQEKIIRETSFGGGCINDTVLQFSNPYLPFGGVGASGIGSYHGKKTFDTFTHYKSVLKNSTMIDLPFRYPPYGKKLKLLKMVLK